MTLPLPLPAGPAPAAGFAVVPLTGLRWLEPVLEAFWRPGTGKVP